MNFRHIFHKWVSYADSFYQWIYKGRKTMFDDYHAAVNLIALLFAINIVTLLLFYGQQKGTHFSESMGSLITFLSWLLVVFYGVLSKKYYSKQPNEKVGYRVFMIYIVGSILSLFIVGYYTKSKIG